MPMGKLDDCTVPDLGLPQVFFEDPRQVTIELNFPAREAHLKVPE